MKRRILLILLAVLLLLVAAGVAAYPLISNYVNNKYQSVVRTNYEKQVEQADTSELDAALAAAKAYNDSLQPVRFTREQVQTASLDYDSLLNLDGSGIMGYVEVPKLKINLPIYHGTGETVLEEGVGHLVGSSLPVGGDGCHSVLTGHSGVAGNKLFYTFGCGDAERPDGIRIFDLDKKCLIARADLTGTAMGGEELERHYLLYAA